MSDRPAAPDEQAAPPARDGPSPQKDEDFRLACRRYSRLRARMPR